MPASQVIHGLKQMLPDIPVFPLGRCHAHKNRKWLIYSWYLSRNRENSTWMGGWNYID